MRSSIPFRMPIPRSTYYDKHYRQAPALIRARQTYLVKNLVTGAGLFAFVIGVYAFTIKAVSQDEFSDVIVPDTPRQPTQAPYSAPPKTMENQK